MRIVIVPGMTVLAAALSLSACGNGGKSADNATAAKVTSGAPVKHQPGSWSNKIEITRFDGGPGIDNAKVKAGLQSIFDAASGMSICITPAIAEKDNPAANMERLAAQGKKCDFTRKVSDGEKLDFAGVCSDASGTKVRVAITGTNAATEQNLVVVSEPIDASGATKGAMEMHVSSHRTGACKPGDTTPPVPGATS